MHEILEIVLSDEFHYNFLCLIQMLKRFLGFNFTVNLTHMSDGIFSTNSVVLELSSSI